MHDDLQGIWRLVESRAWDEQGRELAPPYGAQPLGTLTIQGGRLLAALCKGGDADGLRGYTSYGGPCTFDGTTLETTVDMASDPTRIGSLQVRQVVVEGDRMTLRPPLRALQLAQPQQRELVWERVWRP